jgi:Xaa-Pro aminopeptidase
MSLDAVLDPALHRRRRQLLLDRLGDGLLLLPTATDQVRNSDVHQAFRPGSDFHFLTGFPEPEALLCAWRTKKGQHHAVLFVRPRDKEREIWDGRRFGVEGAKARFGADEAYPIGELAQRLPVLVGAHTRLFHRLGGDRQFDQRLIDAFAKVAAQKKREQPAHPSVVDPMPTLWRQRLIKDEAELETMRRAAAATVAGHVAAMQFAAPGMHEFDVQAAVEAAFRMCGSPRNGYGSIVASGPNACVLHYHENSRRMKKGDLLLLDAGAEIEGVTGDVTRTFPVDGRFSPAQREVYEVVLKAQRLAIAAAKPGATWDAPHKIVQRELTKGLVALGVLRGDPKALLAREAFKPFYMHGTSHWLGRDVHDVGSYQGADGKPARLEKGMVLTIEPGLYFGERDRRVPARFRGIGVRIEDEVLITKDGNEVLTAAAPKTVAEIEAAWASRTGAS